MNIKDYLPPVLIRLGKRIIGLENGKEYENYSQAVKFCTSDAYQNTELCNVIADKTVIHAENLRKKPFGLNSTNVPLLSVINQYLSVSSKKKLNILDFGGACGAHYFEIKRFIPGDVILKWHVVETDQIVKSSIERGLNNDELKFVNKIEDVKTEIDIIYSSCALHYVPDPYEFLNKLINVKAKWIFFNKMLFNENDRDFITIQKSLLSSNGPGKMPKGYNDRIISYPQTTLSFHKFNSGIIENNYELEWIFDGFSDSYYIKNDLISVKGVLYIKK
jgi:putative methyltransferase (TIGR04325 family)